MRLGRTPKEKLFTISMLSMCLLLLILAPTLVISAYFTQETIPFFIGVILTMGFYTTLGICIALIKKWKLE